MKEYYLNANAHIKMHPKAIEALVAFNNSSAAQGHPSSPDQAGRQALNKLEECRFQMANLLGTKASNLFFTSSCTQACEWGMQILAKASPQTYISPLEHPAVRQTLPNPQFLPINADGVILPFDNANATVSCLQVQNEIGIIEPIENIKCKLLFSDLSQSVGKISLNLSQMNVDIAVLSGHKFGGSAGVGILYLKDIKDWSPFGTGSRYAMDRPGTPDVGGIVATAAALEEELMTMPERLAKCEVFQTRLENILEEDGLEILSKNAPRVKNTTTLRLAEPKALELLLDLSRQGIYVGLGSACGSLSTGPSLTLRALGYGEENNKLIRLSQHGQYGEAEATNIAQTILKTLKNL